MTAIALYNIPLGACTQDPDRWTTTPDAEAKVQTTQPEPRRSHFGMRAFGG